jgi:hypothetical protein
VDLRRKSREQLAALILEKLGRPQFEFDHKATAIVSGELQEEKTEDEDIPF